VRGFLFIGAIGVAILWLLSGSPMQVEAKSTIEDPALVAEQQAEIESLEALHARILLVEESDKEQYKQIDELQNKVASLEAKVSDFVTKSTQNSLQNKPVVEAPKPKVEQVLPKSSPAVVKAGPVVSTSGPVTNGTYYQADAYRSQWTYPGDIASHAATVHGISTAGKTKEQLEREHDMAHNGTRVTYAPVPAVVRSTVRYAPQTRSNCPGGVCPTQPTVRWNGILRRR
jgi:hypothetical protein